MKTVLSIGIVLIFAVCASAQDQLKFDTPKQAAEALATAAANFDLAQLQKIFGPDGKDLVASGDAIQDKNRVAEFTAKAKVKLDAVVDPKNKNRATIVAGADDWPMPVPVVKKNGKWYFDSKIGHDEILRRHIGANELDAIQVCRGFVEAQKDYAADIHDNSGAHQYAQRIISTPGKQDGLYWKNADGTSGGPIGESVARAIEEGYTASSRSGYHGYFFKVLKGQGPSANLGEMDFVVDGLMIGGFALIAAPMEYRVTGVKTFMVSHDGIVYEKDLGPDTMNLAKQIDRFNPDKTWRRTDDEWPPDSLH
jgi:hypothetical protein